MTAVEIHGYVNKCPELEWNGEVFTCKLVGKNKVIDGMIGEGCGVSWNRWRKDVKKRGYNDYCHYLINGMLKDISKGI